MDIKPVSTLKLLFTSLTIWVSISSASILVLLSGAPPEVCALWRLMLSLPLIYVVDLLRGRPARIKIEWHHLLSGSSLALHFIAWMSSLFLMPVYSSTLLVTLYPIYSLVIDVIVFRRRLQSNQVLGLVACTVLVISYLGEISAAFGVGALLAVIAGLAVAVYFEVGGYARHKLHESTTSYALNTYTVATLLVAVYTITRGIDPINYSQLSYLYFALMAILPMMLGHTLMNYLLGSLPAPLVTAISYGEPFGAGLLAHLILGQELKPDKVLLGLAIIATIFTTITGFNWGKNKWSTPFR